MKPSNLYNYPKDRIETRKLVRQLRNLHLHGAAGVPILRDVDPSSDLIKSIASIENEIVIMEEARRRKDVAVSADA
jgi:hypothetical protein